jgi:CRP-like cAMP-binding protein
VKEKLSKESIALLPRMLERLPEFDKSLLKQSGSVVLFAKGDTLVQAGTKSQYALYVTSGWVSVSVEGTVTHLLGPTHGFMSGLRDNTPAWAELTALSKGALLRFEIAVLRSVMERNPQLAMSLLEGAIQVLARTHVVQASRGMHPVEQRLADVLWHVSAPLEDGTRRVPASLTQTVLASLLGTTREEVNRKRQLLVKTGYLFELDKEWYLDAMTPMMLSATSSGLAMPR